MDGWMDGRMGGWMDKDAIYRVLFILISNSLLKSPRPMLCSRDRQKEKGRKTMKEKDAQASLYGV